MRPQDVIPLERMAAGEMIRTARHVHEYIQVWSEAEREAWAASLNLLCIELAAVVQLLRVYRPDLEFIPELLREGSKLPLTRAASCATMSPLRVTPYDASAGPARMAPTPSGPAF